MWHKERGLVCKILIMVFSQVDASPDLPGLEKATLSKWNSENLFEKSLEMRKDGELWTFYEGPPTANGVPGIHHIWARVFKDVYPRYWSMRGKYIPRIGGWDCHGLPVEIEVEKELGFTDKSDIEKYGIEKFNKKCSESVQRYVGEWEQLTERIGMWVDIKNAYWTMSNTFIESIWWIFARIWEKGLIYEGSKVVPYCGRCGTALSSHEVAQGYKDITDNSVFVRFEVEGKPYDLLAWTTTPWTLVSNVALALNPEIEYVEASLKSGGRNVVFAKECAGVILGEEPDLLGEIVGEVNAVELVGEKYKPVFSYLQPDGEAHKILAADFVSTEEGSGIVHMASSFGEIDREICEANQIATLNPVDAQGKFMEGIGQHSGKFVIDSNAGLISELGDVVYKEMPYKHSYPHCWRCETPLIYWAKPTWFAATSQIRSTLLEENSKVNWHPAHIKEGRFGTWLEENVDWALSRDRFWGTPIPIWRCGDCGEAKVIESVEELSKLSGRDLSELDLHRPFIDEIVFPCNADCGGTSVRVPSVLDAWFDSGSVPLAQFHYPFENTGVKKTNFPADFICEAIDQTRGWFYSLIAVNTLAFGEVPYKNVVCLAHILDKAGLKMSKSKGNVIAPMPLLDELGADSIRWYFLADGSPWTPRRMSVDEVVRSTRQTLLTLWNVYSFFVTYANIDGWNVGDASPSDATHSLDLWLRSRLATTIEAVTDGLAEYDSFSSAKAIRTFVDDLSNWYVRRSRSRFWKGDDPMGHAVLYEALTSLAQLLAPFCPFLSDEIYRNLVEESVHLSNWPDLKEKSAPEQNLFLERETEIVRKLATLGRSARAEGNVKVRQPLQRALIVFPRSAEVPDKLSEAALNDLAEELNVKSIEHAPDLEELFSYEVRPNFKTLGPRMGEKMKKVAKAIEKLDGKILKAHFAKNEMYSFDLDEESVEIKSEDVKITAIGHQDLAVSQEGEFSIALDMDLNQELLDEGVARELIRHVNEHRKNLKLNIEDRINLEISTEGWVYKAINSYKKKLTDEVLAAEVVILEGKPIGDVVVDLTEDGGKAGISVTLASLESNA